MSKVILIEFNELCPHLLDRWMDAGRLPNFKRLYDLSEVFITEADETVPPNLEPWIQWYSVHTGQPFQQHKVFHLTDGPRAGHPDIWSILMEQGKSVWNCGSMNARGFARRGSAFLPDPWCTTETPHPSELGRFHRFVARAVQEYSNAHRPFSLVDYADFLLFLASHGIRFRTAGATLAQLAGEVNTGGKTSWRRATTLDQIQFDVFRYYYRRLNPDFSTFFSNSTAHLQHTYWRCLEPTAFTVQPTVEESSLYGNAILYGYEQMDRLLRDFFHVATPDTTLVFATALSQQPYLKYEHIGGHRFYRPRHVEALMASMGLCPTELLPMMTHQYLAHFASVRDREEAERVLLSLSVNGEQIFQTDPSDGAASLYFGSRLRSRIADGALASISAEPGKNFDFHQAFYLLEGVKSGRHHPDGCFWVATGRHVRHETKVSILDVLPTMLGMFGIDGPNLPGRNLLSCTRDRMAA